MFLANCIPARSLRSRLDAASRLSMGHTHKSFIINEGGPGGPPNWEAH